MDEPKIMIAESVIGLEHDKIINFDLRSLFEDDDFVDFADEFLHAMGEVGTNGDTTYAIDRKDKDGNVMESYLYVSVDEYLEDCKLLGLCKKTYKVWTSIEEHLEWNNGEDEYTSLEDDPRSLGLFSTYQKAIDQCDALSDAHMEDGDEPDGIYFDK